MAVSKPNTSLSVDDIMALAGRLHTAGSTGRRIDWEALQGDLLVAARLIRTLVERNVIHSTIAFGEAEGR
jgi:hypothetical protein